MCLNNWLARGEKISASLPGDEAALAQVLAGLDPIDREYLDFFELITTESAKAEMQAVLEIRTAAQGTSDQPAQWGANKFLLTHRYPERWGRKVQQREMSGPGGKPIQFEDKTEPISDTERLARIQKLMGAIG